jgi:acyl phosphate:glycerol-3-phosphate acyltransferase
MTWLIIAIVSYLVGSIPSGYLLAKTQGIDIREHGSRNIGATNVLRVLGKNGAIWYFSVMHSRVLRLSNSDF